MQTTRFLMVAGALVGCGGGSGTGPGSGSDPTSSVCTDLVFQDKQPSTMWQGSVFTIVMENKSQAEIFGNANAPFINALANDNAVATGYRDSLVHPSEPNYIRMVAGEAFGIKDDADPRTNHIDVQGHIADQLEMQGMSWKSYQESMGAPCGLTSNGLYAAKHNPFVYFDDINGWDGKAFQPAGRCTEHVVDYSELDADLASGNVPKYAFITPNLQNDMHDGSIAKGDAWLANEVPKILSSDAFNHGGVLFLAWDESSPGSDDPPMIVISANAKRGFQSAVPYDAASYLKTVQTLLGLQSLPCAATRDATTATMDDLFDVPLAAVATTP
jgi:phospholipase C